MTIERGTVDNSGNNVESKEDLGIRLKFRVSDNHLINHTLKNTAAKRFVDRENPDADVVSFQKFAYNLDPFSSAVMADSIPYDEAVLQAGGVENLKKKHEDFMVKILSSKEYQKVAKQTVDYAHFCKDQWDKNYEFTYKAMKDLTNLDLNKNLTVFITHPGLRNGKYLGDNKISWGGKRDKFPNYETTYLWHEVLHSYLDLTPQSHSLIQFATDNELRTQMNGGSYPPYEGHAYLFPLMEKIQPQWEAYKAGPNKDIMALQEQVKNIPFEDSRENPKVL